MPEIEIPGVGTVDFPDSMSDDAITAAAAKLHQQHSDPTFQYKGLTQPLINPKAAENLSNKITGQIGAPKRSDVPFVGDLIDAAKALPDVARGMIREPAATLKGMAGGTIEGLAAQTDPVTLATIGLPAMGKINKIATAAHAAARAADVMKPLIGADQYGDVLARSVTGGLHDVPRFNKAPEIPHVPQGPFQPMLQESSKDIASAIPSVERRAASRVSGTDTDKLYDRMRGKIAAGESTGTPELRQLGEQKSALDAVREAPKNGILSDVDRLPGKRVVGKNILRPDQSTLQLAQEAAPKGITLKALKKIPMPSGSDDLSKALRQRAHIENALQTSAKMKAAMGSDAGSVPIGTLLEPLKTLGQGALQLRSASMLSGMALPYSLAGDAGSLVTSALERGSLKPLTEGLRLPTNARNVLESFKTGANPGEIATYGSKKLGFNLPGRVIGAFDAATQAAHTRAGTPLAEAQRLLLQGPNKLATGISDIGNTPGRKLVVDALLPFKKTPSNFFSEGLRSFAPDSVRKGAITAGTIGAGYETGQHNDNPTLTKLGAAAAGTRGIPFLVGAGLGALKTRGSGAASKAVGSFSPIQDFGMTQMITNPKAGVTRALGLKPAFMRLADADTTGGRTSRVRRRSPR